MEEDAESKAAEVVPTAAVVSSGSDTLVLHPYRMRGGETGPGLLGPPLAFGVRNIPLIPFHVLIKSEPGSTTNGAT